MQKPLVGLSGVRLRLFVAVLLLLVVGVMGLWRTLAEPSIGHRFGWSAQEGVTAVPTLGVGPPLAGVTALLATTPDGAVQRLELSAPLMAETGGLTLYYRDQQYFYEQHAVFWTWLTQARSGSVRLEVEHAGGVLPVAIRSKTLAELGLRFWVPWCSALLALSVGLAVWVYRAVDGAANWYVLASLAYSYWMMVVAGTSSRLLTQEAVSFQWLHWWTHAAAYLYLIGLCMLLWRFPVALDGRWLTRSRLLAGMALWSGVFMLVDVLEWVDTISVGFRLPNLALAVLLLVLYLAQWRRSRGQPLHRAQIKWLGLLLMLTLAVPFVASLYAVVGVFSPLPIAYGMVVFSLIFVGFVPLVTRLRLFELEAWWPRAWLWFLGGVLVIVLDVALLLAWPLTGGHALMLAMALAGWIYFPLRQWLWRRLSDSALPQLTDVLPDVVALATESQVPLSAGMSVRWRRLWELQFQPLSVVVIAACGEVEIRAQGQRLRVPGVGALPALELGLPMRGTRLFSLQDVQRCQQIVALVRRGLEAGQAQARGAHAERQRIAADLHDDLGAKLLTIAQCAQQPDADLQRLSRLARQALDDMRLSVRGLTTGDAPLADVLADWRAETVQRLSEAGLDAEWTTQWLPESGLEACMLPASTHVQLTRVLREAVSNTIRHSGATRCRVCISLQELTLLLQVEDDGRGLALNSGGRLPTRGFGLPNMERRARKLGGTHLFARSDLGGLLVSVAVPVGAGVSATMDPP
ncbi:MAG: hypothetical protein Q8S32_18010 [Burkholderiaceae bacterium]|nr:hypothetical protein [Burkholderiaceae bacterium]